MTKAIYATLMMLFFAGSMFAQSVGINNDGSNPDSKAILDVSSTTKGLLPPRMTYAQKTAITSPPAGLMVWCSNCGTNGELQVYNGTSWTSLTAGTPSGLPGAPTIGVATAGIAQATVTFTAPASNGGSTIISYTATSNPGGFTGTLSQAGSGTITVTGLANGTAYTFTVTATNATGTGAASAASNSATTATVPGAPTIGTATAGNAQASVPFTQPASNGGSTITSYTATSTPDNFTGTLTQAGSGTITVTGLTNGTAYTFTVTATNAIGTGVASAASNSVTPATVPGAPTIGTATAGDAQASVPFTASGSNGGSTIISYTATSSPGSITGTLSQAGSGTITVTGLTNGTAYTFTVKATNAAGQGAASDASNSVTPLAGFTCGTSITKSHLASGGIAPVDKTVTYGTVTNIPGEVTKCWITRNLGASQQATIVSDNTEASAGWYWQFNRKQGYKHDGTTRTPSNAWDITNDNLSVTWEAAKDPCTIELGAGWRIPTNTEWTNVDASGNWTNWDGPYGSALKLHAAGALLNSDGSLYRRGSYGYYFSNTQNDATNGLGLKFSSGASSVGSNSKAYGFSIRCVRD